MDQDVEAPGEDKDTRSQDAASSGESRDPRRLLKHLGKRLLLLAGALVVLEVLLRLFAGNMAFAPYTIYIDDGRCIGLEPNARMEYSGWLWPIEPVIHDANEYGYRGEARPPEKSEGVFRIAALGDSFTYGMGLNAEDALPAQLEGMLAGHSPAVEVLNFGGPGYALKDYVEQYRYFVQRWRPDLLLVMLHDNDLEPSFCDGLPKELERKDDLIRMLRLVRAFETIARVGTTIVNRAFGEMERPVLVEDFLAFMQALQDETNKHGTELAVVVMGNPLHVEKPLNDVLWLLRIPALVNSKDGWKLDRIAGEGHFNADGLGKLSQLVLDWLQAEKLLPTATSPTPP